MSGSVPYTVGICDVINNVSKEHNSFNHNIRIYDADATKLDEKKYYLSINDGVLSYYYFDKDGQIKVINFDTIDKDKDNINKEIPVMLETNDDAEYIIDPPSLEDFSLHSDDSEVLPCDLASTSTAEDVNGDDDINVDVKRVDMKVMTEKQKCLMKKESPKKKRKLHEISEPLSDENEEKRRLGAINAKNNREKNKAFMDQLKKELSKEKEKNKDLEYQLIIEEAKTKIAVLEKEKCELKYEILSDKFDRLSENLKCIKNEKIHF